MTHPHSWTPYHKNTHAGGLYFGNADLALVTTGNTPTIQTLCPIAPRHMRRNTCLQRSLGRSQSGRHSCQNRPAEAARNRYGSHVCIWQQSYAATCQLSRQPCTIKLCFHAPTEQVCRRGCQERRIHTNADATAIGNSRSAAAPKKASCTNTNHQLAH